MTNTEKRAWIYTRIDAPEGAHGALKGQGKDLICYAEPMGFAIAETSSDFGGGTYFERPGLARFAGASREGSFDVLLVKSLSRLGRDMAKTTELLRQLNDLALPFSPRWKGK